MSSAPTPKQWFVFILVNILVSATTALLVVRTLLTPDPSATSGGASAPISVAGPRAASAPATSTETAIPLPTETATAQPEASTTLPSSANPTPTLSAIAATSPQVRITTVLFPGQLSREVVVLVNEGDTVDLSGWTLASSNNITYTFGNITLLKDSFINLHTTTGADVPTDLFWDRSEPAWKVGDVLTLSSKEGRVITSFTVRQQP
ncbi:MAG: lamin tail domain-containing protein [Anaerolineae bacterium]|nr:lamin tail domain-containing protein [Thermoflexales bacterium]MDW8406804.1 lamin tail domain-containing protein [Anaerolineae bacterium]